MTITISITIPIPETGDLTEAQVDGHAARAAEEVRSILAALVPPKT